MSTNPGVYAAGAMAATGDLDVTPKEKEMLTEIGSRPLDVIDGVIIGAVAANAAFEQKTLFAKMAYAGLGAVIALGGVKLGHWLSDKLFGHETHQR